MPIFFPPIPPNFIGGKQPYDGNKKLIQGVPVVGDNPPFGEIYAIIDPWLPRQPQPQLGTRNAVLLSTVAVIADDPPLQRRSLAPILRWFDPEPVQVVETFVTLQDGPASSAQPDNPPLRRIPLESILRWFEPEKVQVVETFVTLQEGPGSTPATVDDPPRLRRMTDFSAWFRPQPQPVLPAKIVQPGDVFDDPPGAPSSDITIVQIYNRLPILARKLPGVLLDNPPSAPVVGDNPPFGYLEAQFEPFIVKPGLPTLTRKLDPSTLNVVVTPDNAPPLKQQLANILLAWQPRVAVQPTLPPKLLGSALDVPVVVDNPPLRRVALESTLRWFVPPPIQIVETYVTLQEGPAVVTQVDNPPVNRDRGLFASLFSWVAQAVQPTLNAKLNPDILNNPTVTPPVTPRVPVWPFKEITPEEAERMWRESHERTRFGRKEFDQLKRAEIEAAERADELKSKKAKEALEKAADAAAEIYEEARGTESQLRDLTELLNAAASAAKTVDTLKKARAAIAVADQIAKAWDQDEEEAITLLLLNG